MNNINFKIISENAKKGVKNLVAELKDEKIDL